LRVKRSNPEIILLSSPGLSCLRGRSRFGEAKAMTNDELLRR
jgi:hypothetical protein